MDSVTVIYEMTVENFLISTEVERSETFIWQHFLCYDVDWRLMSATAVTRNCSPYFWSCTRVATSILGLVAPIYKNMLEISVLQTFKTT